MKKSVGIKLGDPVIISQADEKVRSWGPWQFPLIEKDDGIIHVSFHIEADSSTAYGLPKAHAISEDLGKTWRMVEGFPGFGLKIANEDRIIPYHPRSLDLKGLKLPEPVGRASSYGHEMVFYKAEDFPDEIGGWHILRKKKGEDSFKKEKINVDFPGNVLSAREGVMARNFFWRMRLTPKGDPCALMYSHRLKSGTIKNYWEVFFIISRDNGYNWALEGTIPYMPIEEYDPKAGVRNGFTEPDVAFMPDGSAICIIRTTDGNGVGPMYWSRSQDDLKTWTKPEFFDKLGVWPELVTLDNNVTLCSYGRPGLFVRATMDPSGQKWDEPVAVISPGVYEYSKDTCSYSAMEAIDDNKVLLIYSDFNYPGEDGVKRKTILARTVETFTTGGC